MNTVARHKTRTTPRERVATAEELADDSRRFKEARDKQRSIAAIREGLKKTQHSPIVTMAQVVYGEGL